MSRNSKQAPAAAQQEGGDRERIAKRLARAGLCSRREAEQWISQGRVSVNGQVLQSPALNVGPRDKIEVDGKPLPARERTRLWLYHKPAGLVTTNRDPEGRRTVFAALPQEMPRVVSIGRLDINTEGLLLLTNDGGLARVLELPQTGWLRKYRVRAHGNVTQEQLAKLGDGVAVDGILYGPIEAVIDKQQGSNVWLMVALREGKNREVKMVLGALGLEVNRLIRVSYGPFQLAGLEPGEVREIRGRTLRDQLGTRLIEQAGADFETPAGSGEPERTKSERAKPERPKPAVKASPANAGKRVAADPLDRLDTKKPGSPKGGGKRRSPPGGAMTKKRGNARADRRR